MLRFQPGAPSRVNALDNVCSSHHVLLFSVTESGLFLQTYTFSVGTDCWLVLQFYLVLTTLSTWELWHPWRHPNTSCQPCCASGWSSFFLAHRLYHLLEQLCLGKGVYLLSFWFTPQAPWGTYLSSHWHGNSLKRWLSFHESSLPWQDWVHCWPLLTEAAAPFSSLEVWVTGWKF